MPYFELNPLNAPFNEVFLTEELRDQIQDGGTAIVHMIPVIARQHVFETVYVVSVRHAGGTYEWLSTQISPAFADQIGVNLDLNEARELPLYSLSEAMFHDLPVRLRANHNVATAILGWRDIRAEFRTVAETDQNQILVLLAMKKSRCQPLAEYPG